MKNIYFLKSIPPIKKILSRSSPSPKKILVFCDRKLESSFSLWKKEKEVSFYFITSGEKDKSVEQLNKHLKQILLLTSGFNQREILFIAIGGGSITDLVGFLASIYKRGVSLFYIPSTYLAAFDSAHGGKNALNFNQMKNVIGTYYFPKAVFIITPLFQTLTLKEEKSAYGELLKIALIEGGSFYSRLKKDKTVSINKYLKKAIKAKLKIVKRDPYELKSERKKLNLGHTLGHILELTHSLEHGQAVLEGILFSLNWSFRKGMIKEIDFLEIKSLIKSSKKRKISLSQFKKYLKQDKKFKKKIYLNFIFIQKPGKVTIKTVSEKEIIQEAKRQGFIS